MFLAPRKYGKDRAPREGIRIVRCLINDAAFKFDLISENSRMRLRDWFQLIRTLNVEDISVDFGGAWAENSSYKISPRILAIKRDAISA